MAGTEAEVRPDRRRELRLFAASMAVLGLLVLIALVVAQQSEKQPGCGVTGRLTNQTATGPVGLDPSAPVTTDARDTAPAPGEGSAGPSGPGRSQHC